MAVIFNFVDRYCWLVNIDEIFIASKHMTNLIIVSQGAQVQISVSPKKVSVEFPGTTMNYIKNNRTLEWEELHF